MTVFYKYPDEICINSLNLRVDDRELEDDLLVGERVVNGGESFELCLRIDTVFRIQVNLEQLGSICSIAGALAHNLRRVHDILQNALLHTSQGASARAHALLSSPSINVLRLDCALSNNHNMTAAIYVNEKM